MSAILENIGPNRIKLTLNVTPEALEEGVNFAYNKNKGKMSLPGFRPGKAPRKLLEIQYGKEIFFDDAMDHILPGLYAAALEERGIDAVSRPEVSAREISSEKGAVVEFSVYTRPEARVMDYTGLEYKAFDASVSEEEIDAEIEKEREKNSRTIEITDRGVLSGDKVNVDFEGFIDGVPFEGGKAEGRELVIGSHSFVDTFEDQLIGWSVGDEPEVGVRFPDDYRAEELKGRQAVFRVKINGISFKEMPKLDDEFAQNVSDFETLGEYRNDVRAKLEHRKELEAEHDKENQLIDRLVERTIVEIPEVMIEEQTDDMLEDFERRIAQMGMTLENYASFQGIDITALRNSYRIRAEKNVKARLALEAVVKLETLEASEEDIDDEVRKIAEAYGMEPEAISRSLSERDRKNITKDIQIQNALKLITGSAVLKEEE